MSEESRQNILKKHATHLDYLRNIVKWLDFFTSKIVICDADEDAISILFSMLMIEFKFSIDISRNEFSIKTKSALRWQNGLERDKSDIKHSIYSIVIITGVI